MMVLMRKRLHFHLYRQLSSECSIPKGVFFKMVFLKK
uniref:Uncharacterized protein n=1 Tax=Elaeophora elaphi TaxID=1147741 RepID=A0A0R3RKC8_9BILA